MSQIMCCMSKEAREKQSSPVIETGPGEEKLAHRGRRTEHYFTHVPSRKQGLQLIEIPTIVPGGVFHVLQWVRDMYHWAQAGNRRWVEWDE